MTRIVLVPGCRDLLTGYSAQFDPISDLRAAAIEAVSWLGDVVDVYATSRGAGVAEALLAARFSVAEASSSALIIAGGSACPTASSADVLDESVLHFDKNLGIALRSADAAGLRKVDPVMAEELGADVEALPRLADLLEQAYTVSVDYDSARHGAQYWVARWESDGLDLPVHGPLLLW